MPWVTPKRTSLKSYSNRDTPMEERILADAGYRGHTAPPDYRFRVCTADQKRRMTPQIKRDMRRSAAIEPVIGHLKGEHRMGRNHLAHASGDASTPSSPPRRL